MSILFEGRLTLDHMATHVPHAFTLLEAVDTLNVKFSYAPQHPGPDAGDIPNQLSISVYGPNGARGTRHNNADQSPVISSRYASPGYLSGPIEAGEWTVEIDVHRILAPGNVTYRLEIDWQQDETAPPEALAIAPLPDTGRRGPGWYRGDLHGHTLHSDARLSVAEYLAYARERKLDFIALTDHNTVSGLGELHQRAGAAITVIDGIELTTFHGHALVLGKNTWTDWRVRDGETMSTRARTVAEEGGVFVIAHPKSEGHPFCTGCRWAYADMLPGPARHVEIWNGAWRDDCPANAQGLALFYHWLNAGYRMVATSGTDTHQRHKPESRIATNAVFARDNTQTDILAALKRGHSYVTSGPALACRAETVQGQSANMGDVVPAGECTLSCTWSMPNDTEMPADLSAHLIRRGETVQTWPCRDSSDAILSVDAQDGDWFTWELRDPNGGLHALTNPVFVGQQTGTWR